jgi:glucose uptake protein
MILPQSYIATLIVMIAAMLCLGSWVSTYKMARGLRFELFYFDFAFGVILTAVVLAFTVGSMGFDGFSFTDDMMHGGKHQWFYGLLAGMIFNLANLLLVAAVSIAGISIAFPLAVGCALIAGSLLQLFTGDATNTTLVITGCLMIVLAIGADVFAYGGLLVNRHEELAKSGKAKSTRRPGPFKGVILCVASGLVMCVPPLLIRAAMQGEIGIGPYSTSFVFAAGMFFSTFVFNIFFVNLPVEGEPVELGDYVKSGLKTHLLGFVGGAIFAAGATAVLAAQAAPAAANLGPVLNSALPQGMVIVAALWGLLVWREFSRTELKLKLAAVLMLVCYICGLALLSVAPLFVRRS